jgi:hypothetical protein
VDGSERGDRVSAFETDLDESRLEPPHDDIELL